VSLAIESPSSPIDHGVVFFDDFESKLFYVSLRLEAGAALDQTERAARAVEEIVMQLPETELESVNTLIGVSASDVTSYALAQNLAQVWVELREGAERTLTTPEVIEELRRALVHAPPEIESYEIDQPQSGPAGRAIEISVRGPELETLGRISDRLQAALRGRTVGLHGRYFDAGRARRRNLGELRSLEPRMNVRADVGAQDSLLPKNGCR